PIVAQLESARAASGRLNRVSSPMEFRQIHAADNEQDKGNERLHADDGPEPGGIRRTLYCAGAIVEHERVARNNKAQCQHDEHDRKVKRQEESSSRSWWRPT